MFMVLLSALRSQGFIGLLMMDRVTGEIIGISNSGVAGSIRAIIRFTIPKPGDEVIVRMEVRSQTHQLTLVNSNGVGNVRLILENMRCISG